MQKLFLIFILPFGEAVKALSKEGIIKGFDNGTFGGESGILKQDLNLQ